MDLARQNEKARRSKFRNMNSENMKIEGPWWGEEQVQEQRGGGGGVQPFTPKRDNTKNSNGRQELCTQVRYCTKTSTPRACPARRSCAKKQERERPRTWSPGIAKRRWLAKSDTTVPAGQGQLPRFFTVAASRRSPPAAAWLHATLTVPPAGAHGSGQKRGALLGSVRVARRHGANQHLDASSGGKTLLEAKA